MVLFYEPKNEADLSQVEELLQHRGIEYFLKREPERGIGPMQVYVAEEDLPFAQALVEEKK